MPKIIAHNPCGVSNMLTFLKLRDGGLVLPPALLVAYLAQSADRGSYAYRLEEDSAPFAIAGCWHHEENSYVWLMVREQASDYMPSFCRLARRHMDFELARAPSGRIRMTVVPGHGPGERLARIMGLRPRYVEAGYRIWERNYGSSHSTGCCGDKRRNDDLLNHKRSKSPQESAATR